MHEEDISFVVSVLAGELKEKSRENVKKKIHVISIKRKTNTTFQLAAQKLLQNYDQHENR